MAKAKKATAKMPPKGMSPKGMHKMPGGMMMSDADMYGMMGTGGKKAAPKKAKKKK